MAYGITAADAGGYSPQFRAGASLLVWWTVVIGLALGLFPRARVPGRALAAGGGLLALVALTGLSMAWAADVGGAFTEVVRASGYLGLFVLVVVASPRASARFWLSGLALGLVAVAAIALGSRIQPSLFPKQDLISLLPSVKSRLSYPLNYWNGLAACMAAAFVLLAWLGGHGRTRAARSLSVGALPLPGLTLYLTSSRGGVAALLAGLAALLAVAPGRARVLAGVALGGAGTAVVISLANAREAFVDDRVHAAAAAAQGREMLVALLLVGAAFGAARLSLDAPLTRLTIPRSVAIGAAGALAVGLVVAVVVADPAKRIDDFKHPPAPPGPTRGFVTRHLASAEGSGRYQFWQAGLDAFSSEPVRGIGAGGYESWWAQHGSLSYFIRDAHSLFVETLAELGILGLAALLAFLAPAAASGVGVARASPRASPDAGAGLALLTCGVVSAAIEWTWELPAAFVPVVVAAAVLTGPALRQAVDPAAPARRSRFGLGVATLTVGWLAVVAAAISLVSETKLDASRAEVRRGDLHDAAADAAAAGAVAPWSGAPRLQLALVRERQGDLPGARSAVAAAAERDTDDWMVWLVATRLAVRSGEAAAARADLRRAERLNPRSPIFDSGAP